MHGKSDVAARNPRATATKEQLRLAEVTQSDALDEDRSRIQKYIKEIIETTRCSQSQAEIALHDAGNNVEAAVNQILESTNPETWSHQKRKGPKNKESGEDQEDTFKKQGSRPARRGPFNANSKFVGGSGPREGPRGGAEGRENRQPRGGKEGGNYRRDRDQQTRPPRRDFNKRDNNDWTTKATPAADNKEDEEDLWGGESLIFNRRENAESAASKPSAVEEAPKTAPPAKPCAAGPLSFAEVVRKNAQKAAQAPPPPAVEQVAAPSESRPAPSNENQPFLDSQPTTNLNASPSPAADLPPPGMHFGSDGTSGNQHDEKAPSPLTSHPPSVEEKVQQQLTDKLKNDLGLPASNATASFSPQKNLHETPFDNKPAAVKAGVVEFLSGELPAASNEFQFGFDAGPSAAQQSLMNDRFQMQNEALPKAPEASRPEPDVLNSQQPSENTVPRQNAAAVLNQYVQQPQHQSVQPPQPQQHLPYAHQQSQQQANQYNRSRNGANQPSSFADNYRDVNFSNEHRNAYGTPSSPPKSQNLPQSMQSSQQQQLPQSQAQQPSHHPQQHMYQPPQLPYNFQYMYSPVPPPGGIRDDFANLLPYQFNLNQMDLNPLHMMTQLAVTSAGPIPGHQPQQHHQNSHQQQNLPQHTQNTHSAPNHQRESTWLGNQLPPASQNNQPNGHGSQSNTNLSSSQQRQSIVDSNSQNILGGSGIQPPPGFANMPAAQYRPQVFPAYPPYNVAGFPYVIPHNNKSKP